MKASAAFPGSYLKAEDLNGNRVLVTIEHVKQEKVGDDLKLLVTFQGKDRGLILNKTNCNKIVALVGTDETDEWSGSQVVLYPTETEFQGKTVPCIRIAAPAPGSRAAAAPPPSPPLTDDDIPF
jgi:hypothetical protein